MALPVGGIGYFKIDGTQYQLRGNFTVRIGGLVKTGVAGADGTVHGYTEQMHVPGFDVEITDSGGMSIQGIQAISASTVTLELRNGKTYVAEGAFQEDTLELDGTQGQFKSKFGCLTLIEVTG